MDVAVIDYDMGNLQSVANAFSSLDAEEEFDAISDTFRDPRVWRIEDNQWVKDNIWGAPSAYGPVHSQAGVT